jgi:hypothetical protein
MKSWDEGCGPIIYLTVRRGPHADATLAYCTCDWERTYRTRRKAEKRGAAHLVLANGAADAARAEIRPTKLPIGEKP